MTTRRATNPANARPKHRIDMDPANHATFGREDGLHEAIHGPQREEGWQDELRRSYGYLARDMAKGAELANAYIGAYEAAWQEQRQAEHAAQEAVAGPGPVEETIQAVREALRTAFKKLRKLGWGARMNFRCCSTCASYELAQVLGHAKYVYWHNQNEEQLDRQHVHLGHHGTAEELAQLVGVLRYEGLTVDWDGDHDKKLLVGSAAGVAYAKGELAWR